MEASGRTAAARPGTGFRNSIIAAGAALIVLIWAAALALVWSERVDAVHDAERNALNLTLAFSEQIARSLTGINEAMDFLEADYKRSGAAFDLYDWAKRQRTVAGLESHISIAGPDGYLKATSLVPGVPGVYIGDREHFRVHLSGNSGMLYVSKPVIGRQTKQWTIEVTRRMDNPDGSFAGVLVFALDPSYLIRLYEPADLGQAGTVALVGLDGVLRARLGAEIDPAKAGLGTVFKGPLFTSISENESGIQILPSGIDGIKRIFAYRRVPGYPLDVVVGLGYDELLVKPNRAARRILAVTGFATAVLALLMIYLVVEINRRSRRELELAAERTKLEAANRDLELSRNAAEAASRAKSEFLANMSHELRTPLNAIIGFSDVMRTETLGPIAPKYRDYACGIFDSGGSLLRVFDDVLAMSNLESGRIQLRYQKFPAAEAVEAAVADVADFARDKEIALSVEVEEGASINADSAAVARVLTTLMRNAVKFAPRGGSVSIGAQGFREHVYFYVEDDGPGIP
ncbi:MAG TPA: histidine kinase dimerization/phospho-acceptor domain-containing protein, partial [Alphaproteobacteria bacterium]|nr:histidine kinase dimerization/phospho-acceptor domain-containing protein [Alphaproteobacteria bacterium]